MNPLLAALRRGFASNVRFAGIAIREHKLRSGLTILGIVVGVTTVIAMVAIVAGFSNNVIGNLKAFGADRIEVGKYDERFGPGGPLDDEERKRPNLTVADAEALRQAMPEAVVSTLVSYDDAEIRVKNGNLLANYPYVIAADYFYLPSTAHSIARGRFFTPVEVAHSALLVILGAEVEEALFPKEDPIGKDITVNGTRYRVVGVLARKAALFGYSPDNKIVLPHGAFARQFGFRLLHDGVRLSIVPKRTEELDAVVENTVSVLRARRRVPFDKPNNFAVVTPDQLISPFRAITGG